MAWTRFGNEVPEARQVLLADAQTSGGLLLAVPAGNLEDVLEILATENAPCAAVVGEITEQGEFGIEVL